MNREKTITNFATLKPYESENLQNLIMKYEFYNIKTKNPQKLNNKKLDEQENLVYFIS